MEVASFFCSALFAEPVVPTLITQLAVCREVDLLTRDHLNLKSYSKKRGVGGCNGDERNHAVFKNQRTTLATLTSSGYLPGWDCRADPSSEETLLIFVIRPQISQTCSEDLYLTRKCHYLKQPLKTLSFESVTKKQQPKNVGINSVSPK